MGRERKGKMEEMTMFTKEDGNLLVLELCYFIFSFCEFTVASDTMTPIPEKALAANYSPLRN